MKLTQNQYYGLRIDLPHSLNTGSVYLCEDTKEFFIYGESGTPSELKIANEVIGITQEEMDAAIQSATDALELGTIINVVESYNLLPSASSVSGKFYFVDSAQGVKWLPGSIGGNYYPKGLYHSTGTSWSYVDNAYQATQSEVDLGINNDKFLTPYTLNNYYKWENKADISTVQLKLNGTGLVKMAGTTVSYDNSNYLTSITGENVTTALGFTPYNATNPSGYINTVPAQSFESLTGKPTTINGYGINDFNSLGDARWSILSHAHTFSSLTNKPTTLSGYSISDAYPLIGNPSGFINSYTETDPVVRAIVGIVKSNGSNISAATSGIDYVIPSGNVATANNLVGLTTSISILNNQSGINTGDNATNSLYSGLSTSKQDSLSGTGFVKSTSGTISYDTNTYLTTGAATSTYQPIGSYLTSYTETDPVVKAVNGLVKSNGTTIGAVVSGTDIKTINSTSILGSGDIAVATSAQGTLATNALPSGNLPGLSIDNEIVLFSGTGGKTLKRSTTTGILKGASGVISNATARTDYGEPTTALATGILKNTTTTGAHTIAVAGDFPTLNQNTTGTAANVTTNANLTGIVTSVGNTTSIANSVITNAMLVNSSVANLSGVNTGDNSTNTLYSGLVSNATHTGDVTGATALTLAAVNSNVGSFVNANVTVNAKGLVTAVSNGTSGATNLTNTPSATNVIINSDTGTDATISLGNGTNAGVSLNDYTTAEKSKLAGIATGATVNSSDATLLTRANHTGTQLSTTISDFNTAADLRVVAGITGKVNSNTAITGDTNTKITYDSKGLVIAGSLLTAGDIPNISESQVTGLISDLSLKQNNISLTNIGTSGASTLIGNTLNIPNYSVSSGSSINKTTQTIDFGPFFNDKAELIVTGQSWVTANSNIITNLKIPNNVDPDEIRLLEFLITINKIVPGVGFTITVYSEPEATGIYEIICTEL